MPPSFPAPLEVKRAIALLYPSTVALPKTVRVASGVVVPTPTRPPLSTMNEVAVLDPITKLGTPAPKALGLMLNKPHGVVVPIPTFPPINVAAVKPVTVEVPTNAEIGPAEYSPP